MTDNKRVEKDVRGEVEVPADAYWGISTQRAIENFRISGEKMPQDFILALAQVKKGCVLAHLDQGNMDLEIGNAILQAVDEILEDHKWLDQFPIDIYQTGSGTQTNMNMNEVLANRANQILGYPMGEKEPVHPNDHVNMGQSSNDVIPTAMHLAALRALKDKLFPAIKKAVEILDEKISEFEGIVKVGRTHLQDAIPIPLSLEFKVYRQQLLTSLSTLDHACQELHSVPIGGTALGTGLNAPDGFAEKTTKFLSDNTGIPFKVSEIQAEGIASHSRFVQLSSGLKRLALSLMKMSNDIRWMGSGPRAGLGELKLPQNEPGSSIMPGKINPTQSEALIQVCLRVLGNDHVMAISEGYGSILDLNVAKPLMAVTILDSLNILAGGILSFAENLLVDLRADSRRIKKDIEQSLMIVTRLSPIVGYDTASKIAKYAEKNNLTIREAIEELNIEIDENLDKVLDPTEMV
jgi:fumarate hydratase class II